MSFLALEKMPDNRVNCDILLERPTTSENIKRSDALRFG